MKTVTQRPENEGTITRAAPGKEPISHPENPIIEDFLQDCKLRGLTRHTIETYASQVKAFLLAYSQPQDANIEELKDFPCSSPG